MIAQFLDSAFQDAKLKYQVMDNAARSAEFVSRLAEQLRKHYREKRIEPPSEFAVFSRDSRVNRPEFGLNELLFDILVAEIATVKSARGRDIKAIRGAEWLIESELNQTNSRAVLVDFNKLVLGSAKNKLLVVAAGGLVASWIEGVVIDGISVHTANFYLGFLPHPSDWDTSPQRVELKRLRMNGLGNQTFEPIELGEFPPVSDPQL